MKVAVLYSGIMTLERQAVLDNIARARYCFPDADFFFSTWKGYLDHGIKMDHYFDEPPFKYYPKFKFVRTQIQYIRGRRNAGKDISEEDIETLQRFIRERHEHKKNNNQHIAHALMMQEYGKNYDIIVRLRYDAFIDLELKKELPRIFKNVMIRSEAKAGFGSRALRVDVEKPDALGYKIEVYSGDTFVDIFPFDHMIIHKSDIIDPDYVWELYNSCKLEFGEAGWAQILDGSRIDSNLYSSGTLNYNSYVMLRHPRSWRKGINYV